MRKSEVKKMNKGGLRPDQSKRLKSYCGQLFKDKDPKHWDKHMEEFLLRGTKEPEKVAKFIKKLKKMGWNQSKYEYAKIEQAICEFQKPEVSSYTWSDHFQYAKEVMMSEVRQWKLKQLEYNSESDLERAIPKKDTHAGFSFILTGKKKKGEYLGNLLKPFNKEVHKALKVGSFNKPILIGSRTQASLYFDLDYNVMDYFKDKTRMVAMVDIIVVMAEQKWARPFQYQLGCTEWYAGGKDDAVINDILQRFKDSHNYWLSIDYSHYDQSIPSWLIREAFDVVRAAFDDFKEDRLFEVVREDFINKAFIDGKMRLRHAEKGVPSGSMFTQIIDSVCNRLMILSYFHAKQIDHRWIKMMIMGDDNIIFTEDPVDTADLEAFLLRNYGVICNKDKCTKGCCDGDDPEFLSRTWRPEGTWRDPRILIAKLLAPERFRDYNKCEFAETYEGKVYYEILCLIKAYFLSFPLAMRSIMTHDVYDEVMTSSPNDALRRSKLATGLVKYMQEVRVNAAIERSV